LRIIKPKNNFLHPDKYAIINLHNELELFASMHIIEWVKYQAG